MDSTLEILGAAKVGVYAIEVAFESASVRFRDERTLAVAASRLPCTLLDLRAVSCVR